jgi:hypothetical protein
LLQAATLEQPSTHPSERAAVSNKCLPHWSSQRALLQSATSERHVPPPSERAAKRVLPSSKTTRSSSIRVSNVNADEVYAFSVCLCTI